MARSMARPQAPALSLGRPLGARSYLSVAKFTREETLDRLNNFHSEVLTSNWADYLHLVYNQPFWEAELEKLSTIAAPYQGEAEVGKKYSETMELMDVLYQC